MHHLSRKSLLLNPLCLGVFVADELLRLIILNTFVNQISDQLLYRVQQEQQVQPYASSPSPVR